MVMFFQCVFKMEQGAVRQMTMWSVEGWVVLTITQYGKAQPYNKNQMTRYQASRNEISLHLHKKDYLPHFPYPFPKFPGNEQGFNHKITAQI